MKTISVLLILFFLLFETRAQEDTVLKEKNLDEVIIFSNKFAERKKNIAQKIGVISAVQIVQTNAQNTGDLLSNTGNVYVQKSQQGGSSPNIRGFEASRVLLIIDGIRMNNAIYRAGHLQNVISIDQNMLEGVEVMYGPASTLYGSDALGGAIHMRTKKPQLSSAKKLLWTGSGLARYSSANNEQTAHIDLSIGAKRFGWLQSYNYSDFNDLKMGNNYPAKFPDFGRRIQYIAHINGVDSILRNEDDRIQKYSGYRQWDITQKFLFRQNDKVSHSLNLQYSNTNNIPRYDRLQDLRNGNLRYTEWYYGPQKRELAAYEMDMQNTIGFNNISFILSYQHIEESRHQREYKRYDRLDNRIENVNVGAFNLDGRKLWKRHELTVGLDGQLNDVKSSAFRKNIITKSITPLDTRYPDGKNKMNYFGIYAQHLYKVVSDKWIINDGIRLQRSTLRSAIKDNSFFNLPFTRIAQNNQAVTGNLGVIYMTDTKFRFTTNFSSGFRAPNVDDASRIFESNTAARQLVVPNENIKPEYTYTADIVISHSITEKFRWEASAFYTHFKNAIALKPFQLNGTDSLLYNGTIVQVIANQNVNNARLHGLSGNFSLTIIESILLFSTINYTSGTLNPGKADTRPLDHIPPLYGKTSFTYHKKKIHTEVYAQYNGWKKLKDYNPSGEDNLQYATAEGTPPWVTLNIKVSAPIHKHLSLQAGIENILDRNYRTFGSGLSASGRNFILALRSSF